MGNICVGIGRKKPVEYEWDMVEDDHHYNDACYVIPGYGINLD